MGRFGHNLAGDNIASFFSVASLEYSAPFMSEGSIWSLTISPPDPDAGFWVGTIGPGGTIIWPDGLGGVAATGTLGPITAPSFPNSITIGLNTLTATNVNRTSGGDDYNATITPDTALSQEITDAINDPLNSFLTDVFATDQAGSVLVTAQVKGVAGNSIVLTSSSLNQLFGPWPVVAQGLLLQDSGGGADLIVLQDGSTWAGIGFPAGPQTIILANAENAAFDGSYPGGIGGFPQALAIPTASFPFNYPDDNTATVTAQGLIPAPGTLSGGVDP